MAKITGYSPVFGIPFGTPVPAGLRVRCDRTTRLLNRSGCGTVFVTEGNEGFSHWVSKEKRIGWVINCPSCGGDVGILHL